MNNSIRLLKNIVGNSYGFSYDDTPQNILMWYDNYKIINDQIIIRVKRGDNNVYKLPIGGNLDAGLNYIRKIENGELPVFWHTEGSRLNEFKEKYGNKYLFVEDRDSFEYIYLRCDLVYLSGKKYHSKRNYIHQFDKMYNWHFELLNDNNKERIRNCAYKWYSSKEKHGDKTLAIEKEIINFLLDNYKELNIKGGCIVAGGNTVAFSLGYEINNQVFDVCIEKALPEYAGAYSVINREFAKSVEYKYFNREEDLGIDGLRKSKLSYHPIFLVKKYYCYPKGLI